MYKSIIVAITMVLAISVSTVLASSLSEEEKESEFFAEKNGYLKSKGNRPAIKIL